MTFAIGRLLEKTEPARWLVKFKAQPEEKQQAQIGTINEAIPVEVRSATRAPLRQKQTQTFPADHTIPIEIRRLDEGPTEGPGRCRAPNHHR